MNRRRTAPPRVTLVGATGYAKEHLRHLLRAAAGGRLELAGVVVVGADDPESRTWLAQAGCRLFASQSELLDALGGKIDLCVVPTPIHLHAPMTIAALEAGANVLVEKPLTADLASSAAIAAAERKSGRFVAVGFQDVYADAVQTLKRLLLAGEIGDVQSLTARALWPRPDDYYARNDWAGRIEVAGTAVLDSPLNNAMAHHLNLLLFLAGSEPAKSAEVEVLGADLWRVKPIEMFDTAAVRMATPGRNCRLLMLASHSSVLAHEPEVQILGAQGWAHWQLGRGVRLHDREGRSCFWPAGRDGEAMAAMYERVLARLDDPSIAVCSVEQAMAHVRCIQAIHRAADIVDVPAGRVVRGTLWGRPHRSIAGLESIFEQAFARQALFSELETVTRSGRPGARPPS